MVRQETVQDIFIRTIFGKQRKTNISDLETNFASTSVANTAIDGLTQAGNQNLSNAPEPVRIIHKDQESISAFCTNPTNPGLLALATPRELQEIDVSLLLNSPNWFEDECELDIMNLNRDAEQIPASSFLVVQTSPDK